MLLIQVRSAYRKKGWAFTDPQGIEQCAKEGYVQKLRDQAGEGCHLWGSISVNKVYTSDMMTWNACASPCTPSI